MRLTHCWHETEILPKNLTEHGFLMPIDIVFFVIKKMTGLKCQKVKRKSHQLKG